MDYGRPELADRLAAEYVAGTLRGPARRRFEGLLPAHPMLRASVRAWQDRLMPLTASLPSRQPSADVWRGIETRIAPSAAGTPRGAAADTGAAIRWRQRLSLWRGLAALASVAAIGLAVLLASPGPVRPPVVVVLSATSAGEGAAVPATFIASISGDGRALVTRPLQQVTLTADHALELWAVPAQGAPRSLGLISPKGTTIVRQAGVLQGADALAVSLEPPGGSPTGVPTGPVLWAGKLRT